MKIREQGFTLVETMVAVGLLGGIALLTTQLISQHTQNQKYILGTAAISRNHSMLRNLMVDKVKCEEMFKGKAKGVINSLSVKIMDYTSGTPTPADVEVFRDDKDYGEFTVPADGIVLKDSTYGAAFSDLEVRYLIKGTAFSNGGQVTKTIPIIMNYDPTTLLVTSCGAVVVDEDVNARKKLCDELGLMASWDATQSKCKLSNKLECPWGHVPVAMVDNWGSFGKNPSNHLEPLSSYCKPVEQHIRLDEIFSTEPGATVNCAGKPNFSLIKNSKFKNKISIQCN